MAWMAFFLGGLLVKDHQAAVPKGQPPKKAAHLTTYYRTMPK